MISNSRDRVLVLGGGNVERVDSGWATKSAIARYLHDLADEFGSVTWLVQQSGTWGIALHDSPHALQGLLDAERVRVVPFDYRLKKIPSLWRLFLKTARGHSYGIFFLPASVPFSPILRLVTWRMRSSAAYLAGDYIDAAGEIGGGRWLGWNQLQKLAHIVTLKSCHFVIARGQKLSDAAARFVDTVHKTIPIANIDFSQAVASERIEPCPGRILFVGVVAESKGVGVLMDSMKTLIDTGRHVTVDVCGDGPDLARYEDIARELGIDSSTRFLGWVDDPARLDRAFDEAALLVMPSTTHPEGVPRVIDEAIARGIPVVSTTAGGVSEEFTRGEVRLVEPGSVRGLADAIEALAFDAEERSKILELAAERRTWLLTSGTAGQQHAQLLRSTR